MATTTTTIVTEITDKMMEQLADSYGVSVDAIEFALSEIEHDDNMVQMFWDYQGSYGNPFIFEDMTAYDNDLDVLADNYGYDSIDHMECDYVIFQDVAMGDYVFIIE